MQTGTAGSLFSQVSLTKMRSSGLIFFYTVVVVTTFLKAAEGERKQEKRTGRGQMIEFHWVGLADRVCSVVKPAPCPQPSHCTPMPPSIVVENANCRWVLRLSKWLLEPICKLQAIRLRKFRFWPCPPPHRVSKDCRQHKNYWPACQKICMPPLPIAMHESCKVATILH